MLWSVFLLHGQMRPAPIPSLHCLGAPSAWRYWLWFRSRVSELDEWVGKVKNTASSASTDPIVSAEAASFGPVSITASVLSSSPESNCEDILATIKESHPLGCTNSTTTVVSQPGADTKVCSITWKCLAPLKIPGIASVKHRQHGTCRSIASVKHRECSLRCTL